MQALQAHEDLDQLKAQSQLLILQFARPQCAPCASLAMRLDEWAQSHPQATLRYIDISQWPPSSRPGTNPVRAYPTSLH